jgi:DNA gyrase inhibitor GyrI
MVTVSQPVIRMQPQQRVIYVERVGTPDGQLGESPMDAQNTLHKALDKHGLTNRISYGISMMPDGVGLDSSRAPRYRGGYMLTDNAPLPADPDLQEGIFDPGKVAVFTYTGGWEGLGEAWGQVMNMAFPDSGFTMRPGTWFEIYLDDPSVTPSDQLRTEICLPVE